MAVRTHIARPCSISEWRNKRYAIEHSVFKQDAKGKKPKKIKFLFWIIKIINLFIAITGRSKWQKSASNIEKKQLDTYFVHLPAAFDGFKILHLSDLHLDCLPRIEEKIANHVRDEQVDLAIITGDIRDHYSLPFEQIIPQIKYLVKNINSRDGIICVLGNHDSYEAYELLEKEGIRVLVNETIAVSKGDEEIYITGLDDVHYFYTPWVLPAIKKSPKAFKIMAVHSPEVFELAQSNGFNFYLTGHTHGGQVCLPFPIITHGVERKFAAGLWRYKNMLGYTSRGAGTSTVPLRVNCKGEVSLITLRKSSKSSQTQI